MSKARVRPAQSMYLAEIGAALASGSARHLARLSRGPLSVEVLAVRSSILVVVRRSRGGGVAHRAAFIFDDFDATARVEGSVIHVQAKAVLGNYRVRIECDGLDYDGIRIETRFRPSSYVVLPFQPRDLYPIDQRGNPVSTAGHVKAAQRGLNTGLLYFDLDKPALGRVLYLQNLTALNPYFAATGTKPDGVVGGEWPELGFLLPAPPRSTAANALPAGKDVILSDAIIVFHESDGHGEVASARDFLQMLGAAYKALDRPATAYRDWIGRARRTLKDIERAPEATVRHYGNLYLHPYTGSEYPDSMVQISVIASIHAWGQWAGEPHPLEAKLKKGLNRFFDPKLGTLRRYLPNVGPDKDPDAVDSWYLYHPLLNLGRLAISGDEKCRELLLKSIDFAIRAARHFNYCWPIQFNVTDFSVITQSANDGRGQTDVGGLYAYVMLLAHQLTAETRFLEEARAAIDAGMGLRFNLNYQANLTAWGAAACMRLWRITNDERYLDQSYVFLASFFHNSEIWESEIGTARHFRNFLAVTCLQDAPYMAIYECFDSYAAFENFLADSGPDLLPAARMLVSEYCKFALDRAWYYYPDALPADVLAGEQRNGHIDAKLSFPLEDLYADGQPAGQVGQEIYGCGAAFIFATRSHRDIDGAPFRLFCDHFIRSIERVGAHAVSIQLDGGDTCTAGMSIFPQERKTRVQMTVRGVDGKTIRARRGSGGRKDYDVPANGRIVLSWR